MTRVELINRICDRVNARSYLEIGVFKGIVLSQVDVEMRVGVDPVPQVERLDPMLQERLKGAMLFPCTSDHFFENNEQTFDVVFVDGLHLYEQAIKDILNAFNCLNKGGYVVVHDLLPVNATEASRKCGEGNWNGDVWKVMHDIHENYPMIRSIVVDSDHGMGILWIDGDYESFEPTWKHGYPRMKYSYFEENRDEFMNIVEPDWVKIRAMLD